MANKYLRRSWQERSDTWREKIKVSNIITRLQKHATGVECMTASQVRAAQVLLDRVMPTLTASEITTRKEVVDPAQLLELLRIRYGAAFAAQISKDYLPPALSAPIDDVSRGTMDDDVKLVSTN